MKSALAIVAAVFALLTPITGSAQTNACMAGCQREHDSRYALCPKINTAIQKGEDRDVRAAKAKEANACQEKADTEHDRCRARCPKVK